MNNKKILHLEDNIPIPQPIGDGHDAIKTMVSALNQQKQIKIGINSVSKSIIKGKIKMIIITFDINPPEVIQHILAMASQSAIPVIVARFTQNDLGQSLGIRHVSTVGLLSSISSNVIDLLMPFSTIIPQSHTFPIL